MIFSQVIHKKYIKADEIIPSCMNKQGFVQSFTTMLALFSAIFFW
ncbi:hypothetical protein DET48_102112 [Vibrio diazotrophicus]|uniref:Uncharacterized protein n=1 Tax=Vibrio diazotrophicus TaxID=685 RepID=A0A329EE74_VIBDI|nr:hypothetical protein DET48_102112 [Vibrio diazotrophicus]